MEPTAGTELTEGAEPTVGTELTEGTEPTARLLLDEVVEFRHVVVAAGVFRCGGECNEESDRD